MRILVALDYDECSSMACRWALARAAGLGAQELVFQHVLEPVGPGVTLGALERASRELRGFVEDLMKKDGQAPPEGVAIRYFATQGKPADEILAAAAAHKVGAVVVGTRGRTGLDRLLLGSVAEAVVRGAPCTVIVVKPGPAA